MCSGVNEFVRQHLGRYQAYKACWNYEDGCVLLGCCDLFGVTGDPLYRQFVLKYLDRVISPEGAIINYPADKFDIESVNCGKALFFAYDQTGEERYRKAMDFLAERLKNHPRCACGNFRHREICPEQIWLDGLYMAQPFRVAYDMRFGGRQAAADVARQFLNVRRYLYDEDKKLYYHACDMAKKQPWADKETGKSPNFQLRSMG